MLIKLGQESQITISKEIVYPKRYVDDLRVEINMTRESIVAGKQPVFDNVDALLAKLEVE